MRISIEHGDHGSGMFSSYTHVRPRIENGAEVKKGDLIAELYKDPEGEEGRLVHLHMSLINGWGTRGTSLLGGGLLKRIDNPGVLQGAIYKCTAEPQGSSTFTVKELPDAKIETANVKTVRVNDD